MSSELTPIPVNDDIPDAVASGSYYSPHSVLGIHLGGDGVTIRAVAHLTDAVDIITLTGAYAAMHERDGIWAAALPGKEITAYRASVIYDEDTTVRDDPYCYLPTLGEMDTCPISGGRHEDLRKVLGARVRTYTDELGKTTGTAFVVRAPNVRAVCVVDEFNYWDGTQTSVRSLSSSGVWEIFVPEVSAGVCHRFETQGPGDNWFERADPMACATKTPLATVSVATDYFHGWSDQEWMQAHREHNVHDGPMSIYEVHIGSWRQGLDYRKLTDESVPYVKQVDFTHVEFILLAEHPSGGSWGYQVTSYHAPSSRYGTSDGFCYLVDAFHREGIGVIPDWVPAHFPKDGFVPARFDGTSLYKDPDLPRGEHPDRGTYVFNFGRHEVRNLLVANALYWLGDFHIDDLRVDAMASMLYLGYSCGDGQWRSSQHDGRENLEAIELIQEASTTAYRRRPGIIMIVEESTVWPGATVPTSGSGLGYGMKWNMDWMNGALHYLSEDPVNRRWHHGELALSLVYAFPRNYVLSLSHDEVVYGKDSPTSKMPNGRWQRLTGLRSLYAYQWSYPGKQLILMGQEAGQEQEWNKSYSLD